MGKAGLTEVSTVASATGLVKEYRSFRRRTKALDGVDLEIRRGEIFGLLGPNGAGKTTFVKCLLGLLRPTDGNIALFGDNPQQAGARQKVGFAPEIPHFADFLSGPEVMAFHGRLLKLPRATVKDQTKQLLSEAELSDAPKRIRAYSKGMVRRLALAQALLGDPEFLVFDEPTADLDPLGRRDVRNKLIQLKETGTTVLLNSHLLSEVERVCDRVAILHRGKVLAIGTIDELVPEGKDLESVFVDLVEKAGP
jgi:ABC-2 type transport system ATP-binding protein